MKVLVIHNTYQQAGGEDLVVRNEVAVLREHGHEVHEFITSNDRIVGFLQKVRVAFGTVFSVSSYRKIKRILLEVQPDLVHIHNFFPLISPSVFYACRGLGISTVFTLHNYRIVCPTAMLMVNGTANDRSLRDGPWWAVSRKIYRNSAFGTAVVALMISVHRRIGTWQSGVTRFIALTEFAASKFVDGGLPRSKIAIKPNFVEDHDLPLRDRSGFLFVGRLSKEKGTHVLTEAAGALVDAGISVRVIGGGPQRMELERAKGITLMGELSSPAVYSEMRSSLALLMPSVWYEGFPLVLLEAYACGLPVIASRLGAMAELVEHGVTGLLFEPGDAEDLEATIRWACDHPDELARMGLVARQRYEERYSREVNYQAIMKIYNEAIKATGAAR